MTVNLPDEVARRLAAEAARRGQAVDQVAADVLAAGLPHEVHEGAPGRSLEFLGMGASTDGRRASDAEEMLAEGFGRD